MPLREAAEQAQREQTQVAAEAQLGRRLREAERDRDAARAKARIFRTDLKVAEHENAQLRASLDAFLGGPRQHPAWLVANKEAEHHGIVTVFLSDAHYGEVVDPREMNGYNKYDIRIARLRTQRFFESSIKLTRNYLKGITYDGAVLALGGDLVSGDIHDELKQTNEVSTYESCEHAVDWIGRGISTLGEEYGKVHVVAVPGNHGRNDYRPRYKKRSAHNADMHIARLLRRDFKDNAEVTFDVPEALSVDFQIYKTRFRMEHLDEAHGGSGISGALAPLLLRVHRQRKVAEAEGKPFDILMGGHFHQLMLIPGQGLIVNGALKGYDEYARGKSFAPEQPQQAFFVVTPERGVTFPAALFVGNRKEEKW